MRFNLSFRINHFLVLLLVGSAYAADVAPKYNPANDEQVLKRAGVPTTSEGLLTWFESRLVATKNARDIEALIKQLGDNSFQTREAAMAQLTTLGPTIKRHLDKAIQSDDQEVARRAREILAELGRRFDPELYSAAVRLLVHQRPEGTTRALIRQMPAVPEQEGAFKTLHDALASLAVQDDHSDPDLVEAMSSSVPIVRAMAVAALMRANALETEIAKIFLYDDEAIVRWLTAMALVDRKEKEAIPVLIDLIPQLSSEQARQLEILLFQIAGDQVPDAAFGVKNESRLNARNKWQQWWDTNGVAVDLNEIVTRSRTLGLTLVCMRAPGSDIVAEIDLNGAYRWKIDRLSRPFDAQMLANGNVLIAERQPLPWAKPSQVTERTTKGEIVWTHKIRSPIVCYRMKDGRTLISTEHEVITVDKAGKVKNLYSLPSSLIFTARPLLNGGFALLIFKSSDDSTILVELDKDGNTVRQTGIDGVCDGNLHVLPNGHLLIPVKYKHRVIEMNGDRKIVKVFDHVKNPISAQRLPNGRTLIGSWAPGNANHLTGELVEVTPSGKVVRRTPLKHKLYHARQR